MDRRSFLAAGAAAGIGPRASPSPYKHRGYLGWITDLATRPDAHAAWPSLRIDDGLVADYARTFELMRRLGFNEISVWGFYVARDWPLDIESSVTRDRGAMVGKILDAAHRYGIRVYAGLGVYSWGFEQIIRANPKLTRGNPQAMCASEPESWEWMRKVIDYVFARFPIDGVSMQSADQGRCRCSQCSAYSDTEYHALLNVRAAEYIRGRWPRKTVGVNSWGMRFQDPKALPSLEKIGRAVDYLIDVHDTSRAGDPAYRRELIRALACDFGTIGGPQVEPPQHWERDRWFLPVAKRQSEHLRALSDDGGRACEYFFHILENPGDEISFHMAGMALSDPMTPWQKHLRATLEELYRVRRASTADALAGLVVRAEAAYFDLAPAVASGTISLEPLVSDKPGPPVYLIKRLNEQLRKAYRGRLVALAAEFNQLAPDIPERPRVRKILRCLDRVIREIEEMPQ